MTVPALPTLTGAFAWLGHRHPDYGARLERWRYIRDHYTGEVILPEKVSRYLLQKTQGETNGAFKERAKNADYTNHFGVLVDSLVGMLAAVDADASRVTGATDDAGTVLGLGHPEVTGTEAARLWADADGEGTAYLNFWAQVATELALMEVAWLMVDPGEESVPRFRLFAAEAVPNWVEQDGRVTEALVCEDATQHTSLREAPAVATVFLHLHEQGWDRYRVVDDTVTHLADGSGLWEVPFRDRSGEPCLPLRRVRLPMKRPVGYSLARKANALFNRESERDHLLRVANFPKFLVEGDTQAFDKIKEAFRKGENLIHGTGHAFAAPDTGPATLATEVLEKKSREFYMVGYREYGDAAKERTATELRQTAAAGPHAFLTVLAKALDGAEAWALSLATQVVEPKRPELWWAPKVTRSDNFMPADPEAVLDRLIARVFGKSGAAVPLGRTAKVAAAKQVAAWMGLPADEAELEAAVTAADLLEVMGRAIALPFPAEVRVEAMAKVVAANGIVDPEAEITVAEGQKVKLVEVFRAQALELARAEDTAKRREAETFGVGRPLLDLVSAEERARAAAGGAQDETGGEGAGAPE